MLRKLTNTLIFCFVISISFAQDYYWVGGSGNWSDINHWATTSGGTTIHAVVPGPNNNVIFDANSGFTTGDNTVTIDVVANCHDMTWNGALNTPEIIGAVGNPLNVYGSWTLQANMSYRVQKTNFRSSSLGETLTTNGTIINIGAANSGVEFDGTGSWTFMDDYEDSGSNCRMVLIQGTLITNGNNLNINGFQSQGTGVRHLDLGSSEITIRTPADYSWHYSGTNATLDAGTSHINLVGALTSTGINNGFRGALNHAYHHVTYSNPLSTVGRFSGSVFVEKLTFMGNATIVSSSNTIDTLILSAGKKYAFGGGQTQTIRSYLSANSPLCSGLIEMVSNTTVPATLQFSPGSVANINNTLIENIAATGNVPVTANNSFDLGGNTNFNFPSATGQTLYWVGGSGDWNDASHWSLVNDGVYPAVGGCVPTPADDVVFNVNSGFTSGNNVVTLDGAGHYCHDMTWNGALNTPEIIGAVDNPLNVYGSWTLQANMSYRVQKTNFRSSSLGETLTTNGTIINIGAANSGVEFDGTGSWTFMDDYEDSGSNCRMVLIQGTLITNGNNLNINGFQSQGTGVRHLDLGSSEITIRTPADYSWHYSGTNATLDAGTSHINLVGALTSTGINNGFRGALNHAYHHVTYSNPLSTVGRFSGSVFVEKLTFMGNATIVSSSNTIDTLILSAGKKYAFGGGQTQTIRSYLSANSPLCSGLIEMVSNTTVPATLQFSPGSVANINNTLIENIAATGNVPVTANNSFDLGGNTNFNFPSATGQTLYWVGGSGDWNDASHWSLVNDGVYPAVGGCVPTPADDVVFNVNSGFTSGNNVVTLDGAGHYCHDMTWNGALNTPEIIGAVDNPLNVYGSWTLQANMSYRVQKTNFRSSSLGETLTTNGTIINIGAANSGVEFDGTGSWTFMDDYEDSGSNCRMVLIQGTLITNGNNLNINGFQSQGTGVRHLDLGSSEITIRTPADYSWHYSGTNATLDAGTSHINLVGALTSTGINNGFRGALNHAYHHVTYSNPLSTVGRFSGSVFVEKLTFMGNATIVSSSNTIDTLILSAGKKYAFGGGYTQTINERFYASGNPCFILFMSSTASGSPAYLNVLGGGLDFNYTNVRDIDASGSYGTLEMGPQSTDAGNNININFDPYDPDAEIEGFGDHLDLPCPLTPFTIYTDGFYPNPSTEFLWGDGSTADTLHITSFGTYTITVNYGEGCVVQDTLHVRPFDITPPVITGCPTDITQSNDSGICGAEVTWTEPIATDECMLDSLVSNFSPGDIFPIGTTTVTYTAYDANLNTATCSFEVTVNDTEAPVIVDCPTDITVNNDLGSCDAVVTWTAPTFTDNCTGTILTSTHEPGDIFPIGTTTVTYTATDASGNTATCSFEVTVNDTENPVIVDCPTDITVNNDLGSCDAVVTWTAPTFTDNCTGTILTSTHEPGDIFPIGTTTVTYTATDASGNTATCSFEVTVNDTENPVIVDCPTDITVNNDLGSCDAVVTWTAPTFTDNCTGTTLTSTHEPGDIFPIGTTTVTYTATDASGNTATCSFEVTVNDTENPVIVDCPTDITVNNDLGSCDAVVTWTAPTFTDNCTGTILTSTHEPGDVFPIGTTTVTYTATDASGNTATCSFEVTVNDTENPVIVDCPTDITVNNDLGSCDAVVTWTAPTFTDNCTGTILTSTHEPGDVFPIGTTTVTYTVTDGEGNTATCSFEVTVNDTENPVIVDCPTDITVNNDLGSCDAVVTWTAPTFTDNCTGTTLTSTHEPGDVFPIGTTTVTYTVTDASGNTATCSFEVTVNDTENPVIVDCPTDITVNNDLGSCDAVVTWTAPTFTDNCTGTTLTSTHEPGDVFPIGTTTVTYTATDGEGNTATCSFEVTVNDTENPVIVDCPTDITVNNDLGSCDAVVSWTAPTFTDNCTGTILTSTHNPGDIFPIGTTTVTYTATDGEGNTATCSFEVTVNDTENPVIVDCPTDITVNNDLGSCDAVVSWTAPTFTDNCTGTILTSTHEPGDVFPIGTTTVTYTATDASGNTATCSFEVTVNDTENPVIVDCPTDITVNNDLGSCDAVVTWAAPTFTDNCTGTILTSTHEPGDVFPIGTTTVTYTVTDGEGNTATCSFEVTVNDTENPVIVDCPTDITVNNDLGSCDAVVSWTAPTFTDNCTGTTLTSTHEPGDVFPIGTTTVTYTATDGEGNTATCSFEVTVNDTENPVIVDCPTDITVNNDLGSCDAVVSWTAPTFTDNCTGTTLTSTHEPGDVFPIGTTTVTYTATDGEGNTATCSFEVTVNDTENPVIVDCPTDITVNNDLGSCDAVVSWTAPTFTDNCTGTILTSTHEPGDVFPIGTTTVTYTATDGEGNTATCSFEVTVNDTENPVIVDCPTDITVNNDLGSCDAVVSWTAPTFTDNCTGTILTSTHNPGDIFPIGTTTVTYTATDGEGNTATCSFEVTVNDTENPVIVDCPTDITVNNDLGSCDAVVSWTAPTFTDNCTGTILTSTHEPGDVFPIGTTTVTYTATDASGNTATCSFEVTVNDTENPVIVDCPTDITVNNDLGSCDAVVTWTAPTFTDNCTGTILTSTHEPGDIFPIGTTTVTYTATDASGNTATCSFEVTVNDTEAPVFVDFPSDTIVVCYGEVVDLSGIVVEDNCSGVTLTSTHEPGDVFPIGTTTVTYTATDASGNQTDTSLVVVVNDFPAIEVVNISENNCLGDNISLEALFDSDLGSVDWYFGQTYLGSDATLFVEKTGTFDNGIYTAVITDNNGCVASDSIHIHLVLCEIVVSEVITPNGDGLNDYLVIEQLEAYPNTSIWIYNRWGAEVYHSDDYQNDWDGRSESRFNVGGDKLPESTYYYLIELGGPSDSETYGKIYKGYFYLKHE